MFSQTALTVVHSIFTEQSTQTAWVNICPPPYPPYRPAPPQWRYVFSNCNCNFNCVWIKAEFCG